MKVLHKETVSDLSNLTKPLDSKYRVQPLENIVWPDASEINRVQQIYFPNSTLARNSDGLLVESRNRVIIPVQCEDLIIRLCILPMQAVAVAILDITQL